jgi:hypothetical protein
MPSCINIARVRCDATHGVAVCGTRIVNDNANGQVPGLPRPTVYRLVHPLGLCSWMCANRTTCAVGWRIPGGGPACGRHPAGTARIACGPGETVRFAIPDRGAVMYVALFSSCSDIPSLRALSGTLALKWMMRLKSLNRRTFDVICAAEDGWKRRGSKCCSKEPPWQAPAKSRHATI